MKYTIKMGCGHEDVINVIGKMSERERKIKYYEDYGLCNKCYEEKKKKEYEKKAKEKEERLSNHKLDIQPRIWSAPFVDWEDDIPCLVVFIKGDDTYNVKDELKQIGYKYGYLTVANDDFVRSKKYWWKVIKKEEKEISTCLKDLLKLGSIHLTGDIEEMTKTVLDYYEKELKMSNEYQHTNYVKYKKALEKLKNPVLPSFISGEWNKKLYRDSIYVDNKKIILDNDQVKAVKKYIEDYENYTKKKENLHFSYLLIN